MSKPLVSLQHSQFSFSTGSSPQSTCLVYRFGEDRRMVDCKILYLYICTYPHLDTFPREVYSTSSELWYCRWAFLTAQHCSLVTSCSCTFSSRCLRRSRAMPLYYLHSPTVHSKTAVKAQRLLQSRKLAGALAASKRPRRNRNGSVLLRNKTTTAKFSD